MRSLVMIVLVAQARVCGPSEPAQPIAPAASVSVTASAAAPTALVAKHGGTVVTVDDVDMEILVKGDGEVVAYPVTASATARPTLTAEANVTVDVPVESGGTRPVVLVWSPVEARFVGRVQGNARVVTTRPADVNVTVVSHGRRRHRRVEHVVVAPAVVVARPGVVVAAEAPRATVVVTAPPPPVIRVQAPVVDVRLRGGIVVDADDRHDEGRGKHRHRDNGLHRGEVRGHGGHRGRGH